MASRHEEKGPGLWAPAFVLLAACSVSADLSNLPCPCAPGYRCVANRCIVDDGTDSGPADANDPDARDAMAPDAGADVPGDVARDVPRDVIADVSDDVSDSGPDAPSFIFDVDEGAGLQINTEWETPDTLIVEGATQGSGAYESEIFDAGQDVDWSRFEWTPDGAYGRPFTDAPEPDYPIGNVDNFALTLAVPFDTMTEGAFQDISAAARRIEIEGPGAMTRVGIFGRAFQSTVTNWARVPQTNIFPETGDHTLSFWAAPSDSCTNTTAVYVGAQGSIGNPGFTKAFVGCLPTEECSRGSGGEWSASVTNAQRRICLSRLVTASVWRHVVIRKTRHDSAGTVEYWLNGELAESVDTNYGSSEFRFAETDFLYFGHLPGETGTRVILDEALFFSRALTDGEITQLFQRGRLSATFQIRVCDRSDCADASWMSLEGEPDEETFDDGRLTTLPLAFDFSFRGRYAQIRVSLASNTRDISPRIRSMRLTAR